MRLASWMKPRKLGGRRIDEDWSSPSRRTRLTRVRTVLEDAPPRLLINGISRKIRRPDIGFLRSFEGGSAGPPTTFCRETRSGNRRVQKVSR
jgi:hypothetical protein